MPFTLSPGVTVIEKDFSSIIPAVSTSAGATAGVFSWGPILEPTLVTSEDDLIAKFGRPNDNNFKSFFTAANFLSYTNNMLVNRADGVNLRNATAVVSGSVISVSISPAYDPDGLNTGNNGFTPGHEAIAVFSAPQTAGGTTATGTLAYSGGEITGFTITNPGTGYTSAPTVTISAPDIEGGVQATATALISGGSVTGFTITEAGSGYFETPTVTLSGGATATAVITTSSITAINITNPGSGYTSAPTVSITVAEGSEATFGSVVEPTATSTISTSTGIKIKNSEDYLQNFRDFQNDIYGMFAAKYAGALGNGIQIIVIDKSVWDYCVANPSAPYSQLITNSFSAAPSASDQAAAKGIQKDELHILVLDTTDGKWTGTPSGTLEKYEFLSKLRGVTRSDGTNIYFRDAISSQSEYLYVLNTPLANQVSDVQQADWDQSIETVANGTLLRDLNPQPLVITLSGGVDQYDITAGQIQDAFAQFADSELYDISLIAAGAVNKTTASFIIQNVAEERKDCVAFISPSDVGETPIIGSGSAALNKIIGASGYTNGLYVSNYAVVDSGWKYQYDRYNDVYRWVPLNGDIAGLCARTDYNADPWFSPGGLNRGQIKSVVRLGFNPKQAERDALYKAGVNPIVSFPGQGTILFGDKTFVTKPSAFDRINVRRLFIVLEKAIATAARFQLFEFNDDFTRAQFVNLVEPFLRDVQGRRGIIDFRVRCDATNNTPEVIDRNEFIASIFVKPSRSINFITLNFVAARTSVSFEEIGG